MTNQISVNVVEKFFNTDVRIAHGQPEDRYGFSRLDLRALIRPGPFCYKVETRSHGAGSIRYSSYPTYEGALEYALKWANRKAAEVARELRRPT